MSPCGEGSVLGRLEQRRVGLLDHLLAEVDVRHAVVEDRVVEHEVGRLGQVVGVVAELRRLDAVGHVLVQARAGAVIVTADATDAARDEVGVARVDALHEDVEAAEHHRGAVALEHLLVGEVDLRVDAQAAHDPRDRVPRHLLDEDLLTLGGLRCRHQCLFSSGIRGGARYQRFWYPEVSWVPRLRHSGSWSPTFLIDCVAAPAEHRARR